MLRTAGPIPYRDDPKRDTLKAGLLLLIALFTATARICLIYAQAAEALFNTLMNLWGGIYAAFSPFMPFSLKRKFARDRPKQSHPENPLVLLCV